MGGHEPKALLMRVYGDLMQAKAFYGELSNQTDDPIIQSWLNRMDERISDDVQWVRHVLRFRFGVSL